MVKGYGLEGDSYSRWFPKASLTYIRISAGKKQGVRRGLLFRIPVSAYGQYLEIKRVSTVFSNGVIIRNVDDDGRETYYNSAGRREDYPPIIRGARITTSPR